MACRPVTPLWARRVQASPCTPPSPRVRGESPSCTAPTRTTTCLPRRSRVTPPSPAKGEAQEDRLKEWVKAGGSMYSMWAPKWWYWLREIDWDEFPSPLTLTFSFPCRHTAEDFIVTPFAQVSPSLHLSTSPFSDIYVWWWFKVHFSAGISHDAVSCLRYSPVCDQYGATSPSLPTSPRQQSSQYRSWNVPLMSP